LLTFQVADDPNPNTPRARFFLLGRSINEIALTHSFLKFCGFKRTLWGHPQLLGKTTVNEDSCLHVILLLLVSHFDFMVSSSFVRVSRLH
jgi:hypothetical protein